MKLDYDLISEYERYNLTADEETLTMLGKR